MHPFLDVSKLSDEEIIERLGKAYTFMNAQKVLGHTPTVLSILEIIRSLENERNERMEKNSKTEFDRKFPDDKKPIELGKLEE
jgi:hypothetical protein